MRGPAGAGPPDSELFLTRVITFSVLPPLRFKWLPVSDVKDWAPASCYIASGQYKINFNCRDVGSTTRVATFKFATLR
jgi:hypothetical protein